MKKVKQLDKINYIMHFLKQNFNNRMPLTKIKIINKNIHYLNRQFSKKIIIMIMINKDKNLETILKEKLMI